MWRKENQKNKSSRSLDQELENKESVFMRKGWIIELKAPLNCMMDVKMLHLAAWRKALNSPRHLRHTPLAADWFVTHVVPRPKSVLTFSTTPSSEKWTLRARYNEHNFWFVLAQASEDTDKGCKCPHSRIWEKQCPRVLVERTSWEYTTVIIFSEMSFWEGQGARACFELSPSVLSERWSWLS